MGEEGRRGPCRCVPRRGRSMPRPLHVVSVASESVGGFGSARPDRRAGIFAGAEAFIVAARRSQRWREDSFIDAGSYLSGVARSSRGMDRHDRTFHQKYQKWNNTAAYCGMGAMVPLCAAPRESCLRWDDDHNLSTMVICISEDGGRSTIVVGVGIVQYTYGFPYQSSLSPAVRIKAAPKGGQTLVCFIRRNS